MYCVSIFLLQTPLSESPSYFLYSLFLVLLILGMWSVCSLSCLPYFRRSVMASASVSISSFCTFSFLFFASYIWRFDSRVQCPTDCLLVLPKYFVASVFIYWPNPWPCAVHSIFFLSFSSLLIAKTFIFDSQRYSLNFPHHEFSLWHCRLIVVYLLHIDEHLEM